MFQSFKRHSWLLVLLGVSSMVGGFLSQGVYAQTSEDAPIAPDRRKPGGSRPDSDSIEAPMRRKPGGSRDLLSNNSCRFDPQELTALIPESLKGATTSASPTLFFAVPPISAKTSIEFVLRDANDQLVYERTVSGLGQAGILPMTLPPNTLSPSQDYHWYLSIICNNRDRAYDLVVEGFVQRLTLDLNQKTNADPADRIKFYQTQNLWQDQLAFLVELKRDRPTDPEVTNLWKQTLKSVNLDEAIAVNPLLP
ncbi:MAG: hypothetical protein DCF12_07350 [Snowella sp.]|nr:MAG: hypothetical protein DCF12_07350 [Snowella sp.]